MFTDEQFKQLMAVEAAKLAMLQGINNAVQQFARKQGLTNTNHNWNDIESLLKNGASSVTKALDTPPLDP